MKRIISILTACVFFGNAVCMAAFKDSGWGARPAGMGGAFTSIADDVNAVLYNPAGIGQLKMPESSFMYSRLFTGLDGVKLNLNYFAYGQPVAKSGALAVSWANFIANGLYREDTVTLNYAHEISEYYPALNAELFIGANVKYLRNGYDLDVRTVDDPVFSGGRFNNALALDLGLLANLESESVGFSVKMLNEPDMGYLEKEYIPREYKLGFCYLFGDIGVLQESLAALDFTYRDKDLILHAGAESFFLDKTMAARIGGNSREITAGLGYQLNMSDLGVQIDYAFIWPLEIKETSGSHRISLLCRFGPSR